MSSSYLKQSISAQSSRRRNVMVMMCLLLAAVEVQRDLGTKIA